jgi:F-type H+-transporting ATPase subunit delta
MNGKANEYALAVFGLAGETKREQDTLLALRSFRLSIDKEAKAFFRSPSIAKEEKRAVVRAVVSDSLVRDFLCVLIDNRRFDWLKDIEDALDALIMRQNKILKLTITSKTPLSQAAITLLKEKYESLYRRVVLIETAIDPSLIAGLKIAYDGFVEDRTIDRRLADLKQRLKGQ